MLGRAVAQPTPHYRLPRTRVGAGSMTASGMAAGILDVARLTVRTPAWCPPLRAARVEGTRPEEVQARLT